MANAVLRSSSLLNSSADLPRNSFASSSIFGAQLNFLEIEQTQLRFPNNSKSNTVLELKASKDPVGLAQELRNNKLNGKVSKNGNDLFNEMKNKFLTFKKQKYMENLEHYQKLAISQAPKVLVIACADSRVCPSFILGFEPGDAFVVRNVANLVPPFESGPTETKAALEFSVNTLEVQNILVVGHSCCGGIQALMSMPDEEDSSSFIRSWVINGKNAKLITKASASKLDFDLQCKYCEKESINHSLLNLLTYPWIKEKLSKGVLSIHGGYYDFTNCTFEKWTIDHHVTSPNIKCSVQGRELWS